MCIIVYLCISMYVYVYLCVSMYIYVYLCIYMYIYVYVCISMYIYVCLCISTSIHPCMHSFIRSPICLSTCLRKSNRWWVSTSFPAWSNQSEVVVAHRFNHLIKAASVAALSGGNIPPWYIKCSTWCTHGAHLASSCFTQIQCEHNLCTTFAWEELFLCRNLAVTSHPNLLDRGFRLFSYRFLRGLLWPRHTSGSDKTIEKLDREPWQLGVRIVNS